MLVLDTWNGSIPQVELYRRITGLTAPVLMNARNMNLAGARIEYILVVDQDRVVRYWMSGLNTGEFPRLNQIADALINKNPLIAFSPRQLYFGARMEVGQTQTQDITFENTGAGPLEITGYTAPAELVVEPASFTVGIGEKQTVRITFSPTQAGAYSGAIVFQHTNTSVGALEVPTNNLTIENRQRPSIRLGQETIELGQPEVGKSVQQTLTITNDGPGALTVADIQSDVPGIAVSARQFNIPAGKSRDITITFSPRAEGAFAGTLTVVSDDPEKGALAIPLSGRAIFIPAHPRADFNRNGTVDFPDFLIFISHFGTRTGDARFNPDFDLTESGNIGFSDFLIFAQSFGKPIN